MAVWNIIERAEIVRRERMDAEYYQPDYLSREKILQNLPCHTLGSIAFVTDGIHASPDVVEEGGVRYLSAKCVKDNEFSLANTLEISQAQDSANLRTRLREGDLLLTTVGTIGNAAVVQPELLPSNIDRHLGLIRIMPDAPVEAYFVATFLNSSFGRFQTLREATGNVQLNLFIEKIRTLQIPVLPRMRQISTLTRKAYALRREALAHMTAAERMLLVALGLNNLDLLHHLFYERQFMDFSESGRMDAEYFSPRYQSALAILGKDGLTIRDIADLAQRRFRPEMMKKQGTFRYIEISSLQGDGVADAESVELSAAPSRAQWIVEPNDVLTSTVRPIRRLSALISQQQAGYVCSSGFAVLRPKQDSIGVEPEVLLTFLRLPIVCEILDLHTTASMYPAIATNRLMAIPISIPKRQVRDQVVSSVRAALKTRAEASKLVAEATAQVEELVLKGAR